MNAKGPAGGSNNPNDRYAGHAVPQRGRISPVNVAIRVPPHSDKLSEEQKAEAA
jgi:hypothetical protein